MFGISLSVFFASDKMRPYTYPRRLNAVREFSRSPKGTHGDVFSLRDPKPAIMEVIDICQKLRKK